MFFLSKQFRLILIVRFLQIEKLYSVFIVSFRFFLNLDGPNLEAGALPTVSLDSEALKMISMECQIEANPTPSYVWYEMSPNASTGMMPYYGQQNPYGQQPYPLQPQPNMPTAGMNVFGTTRQIQRIYQNTGQHAMQCQAQSRGKTVKQQFMIMVHRKLFYCILEINSKSLVSMRSFQIYDETIP